MSCNAEFTSWLTPQLIAVGKAVCTLFPILLLGLMLYLIVYTVRRSDDINGGS